MVDTRRYVALDPSQVVRLAALGGVVGPTLFAVLVLLGGVLTTGYTHVGQKISELGGEHAEYALLQSANFIVLGVFTLGFAWALARTMGPPYRGPMLIGLFAVSSGIGNGMFQCDVACAGETAEGLLHNLTGLLGFLAAIAGMLILARRWREDPEWRVHAGSTRNSAVVAVGGLVWFIATQALDAQAFSGVAQRVFVAALLVWIVATALKLYRQESSAVAETPVPGTLIEGSIL
jgi:hypothetical membrane protein